MGYNSRDVVSGSLGVHTGLVRISLGCVSLVDVGWAGRGYSLGKRSVSFLNILVSSSSAVVCRTG